MSVPSDQIGVNVYFFHKPTVGYCKECGISAFWTPADGLFCPKDRTHKISLFTWDQGSPYPE